jgi:hypothetical protein
MAAEAHLKELKRKHEALDKEISSTLAAKSSTEAEITELKRKKLLLKEEITRFENQMAD